MIDNARKTSKSRGRERGQGLVEFALVLPALMLTLMGIADFGRMIAIYSNLFNAAREGARYGVVNPKDVNGITMAARNSVKLVAGDDVEILVHFDSGPGTPIKDFDAVTIGDRVIVTLNADLEMVTPLMRGVVPQLRLETVSTRTIATLGEIGAGGMPGFPPTVTPDGTTTPSPSPTPLSLDTATPTPTGTPDPDATPTSAADKEPIQISIPLWDGDMVVMGYAQPNEEITLRDIQDPALQLLTTVNADGTFRFDLPTALVAGHVIAVQGYGSIDYAFVEGDITPTPSPSPTATSTPTPTPSTQYIDIAPSCGPEGVTTITVIGHQWPTNKGPLHILWDSVEVGQVDPPLADFAADIAVTAGAGMHVVRVQSDQQGLVYNDSKFFEAPCPITPTPTPNQPNLVVESLALENAGTISTYDPLTFTVAVRNTGVAAANSLFWVDLYADPSVEPPTPSDLMSEASVVWAAVSSLAHGEAVSLTLHHYAGFESTGDHSAYALADTWEQILESNELDNVGGPLTVTVPLEGIPPTSTPTPTPGGSEVGAISGSTWLYINGDVVPQGRVDVYLYDGIDLIAQALSDQEGNYQLNDIPAGSYTVIGETFIDSVLYSDIVPDVQVYSGQTTEYITLVLH